MQNVFQRCPEIIITDQSITIILSLNMYLKLMLRNLEINNENGPPLLRIGHIKLLLEYDSIDYSTFLSVLEVTSISEKGG